jgi:RNA polymerase sigma-70 factor (ECF subfamily)
VIEKEEHATLYKFINQLPAEQKEVLVLRHYADLSFKEIAELTGHNINTCIGRMHYALINLRKMMQKIVIEIK